MNKCAYCGKELSTGDINNICRDCRNKLNNDLQNEALLTPPTADEVCKALSKHFDYRFKYLWKSFYMIDIYGRRNELNFRMLKDTPHLITLIGRFYEGEK